MRALAIVGTIAILLGAPSAGPDPAAASITASPRPSAANAPTFLAVAATTRGTWSAPRLAIGRKDCSTVVGAIDAAGHDHLAAGCSGEIVYAFSDDGRTWTTTTLAPPEHRQEVNPQLVVDGGTAYLAYTRIGDGSGCGGGYRDLGVYVRTRRLPDGAWSSPARIGLSYDGLESFREAQGMLHAIVQNLKDGRTYYVTRSATSTHRYLLPNAAGTASLRLADDGRARVAYETSHGIVYAVFDGRGFSKTLVVKWDGYAWGPLLVLDAAGHADMLWTHSPPPGGCVQPSPSAKDGTYYATNASGRWVSTRFTTLVGPTSLQVGGAGGIHALVAASDGLRYFERQPGGGWRAARLTSNGVTSPVIRLDARTGRLFVAFVAQSHAGSAANAYVMTRG